MKFQGAKVEKIYDKKSEDVVAIKIMEQNMSIYNTRVQEFDIIYKNIKIINTNYLYIFLIGLVH